MTKKILLYSIIIFVMSIFSYSSTVAPHNSYKNISKIVKEDSYSYLTPKEKDFIIDYYEETGEVLLTEKNKVDNVPYLNPEYGIYMNLSDKEKETVDEIPKPIVIDTKISKTADYANPGSKFDLRNVGGKKFVTNQKAQGDLGICWSFASTQQAESYYLVKNNISAGSYNPVFSPRQLDYASASDSLRDYTNEYSFKRYETSEVDRHLGDDGNSLLATAIMSYGIANIPETYLPYNDEDMEKKELQNIINYDNSFYELDSSIEYEKISYSTGSTQLNNFVYKLKQNIMDYGGAYISTQAPGYSCSYAYGTDAIIRVDSTCRRDGGHAMQIIGWDDNYSYSYCNKGNYHAAPSTCSSGGTLVNGTGAWIVRNSWGDYYDFTHLAYDTYYESVSIATDLKIKSQRNWQNAYHKTMNYLYYYVGYNTSGLEFTKKMNTPEKLQKVKFYSQTQGGTYNLSITSSSKSYNNVASITTNEIGWATFDLSSLDIIITDETFKVDVRPSDYNSFTLVNNTYYYNGASYIMDSVSAYTSNVDNYPIMENKDYYTPTKTSGVYVINYNSITKNMKSGTLLQYGLIDKYGNNYSSYLTSQYNKIAANNFNSIIRISGTIPTGMYYITAKYTESQKEYYYKTPVLIGTTNNMSGSGTVSSPYLITNENQLRMMNLCRTCAYKLSNNITVNGNWIPVGTEEEPFNGFFDGNGYTISNLNVPSGYKHAGLFGYVKNDKLTRVYNDNKDNYNTDRVIKKVRLENATVTGSESSGQLIGTITGRAGYSWDKPTTETTLDSIFLVEGRSTSQTGSAGSLVGQIIPTIDTYHGYHNYTVNKVLSTSTISGKTSSGLIGNISASNDSTTKTTINMTNIENLGVIDTKSLQDNGITPTSNTHGSIFGNASNYLTYNLSNYISSPLYLGFNSNNYYGKKDSHVSLSSTKGYNTLDTNTTISSLKESSSYSTWTDFSTNWEFKTINGIKRLPTIKGANIPYTNDITGKDMIVGDHYKLSDDLTNNIFRLKVASNSNQDVVNIDPIKDSISNQEYDSTVTASSGGQTTIRVVSTYDGYEKDLVYNITDHITSFTVTNGETVNVETGTTYQIETSIVPNQYTVEDRTISWESSHQNIATVNQNGLVTPVNIGTTTITGSLNNGMSVQVEINVTEPIHTTQIITSKDKLKLAPNISKTIVVYVLPESSPDLLNWTTSDPSIATVANGTITGVGVGTATVTVSSTNGITQTIEVNVEQTLAPIKKGDANYDNKVDMKDATIGLKKAFGLSAVDNEDLQILDIDNNGKIDMKDITEVLKYAFGIKTTL